MNLRSLYSPDNALILRYIYSLFKYPRGKCYQLSFTSHYHLPPLLNMGYAQFKGSIRDDDDREHFG